MKNKIAIASAFLAASSFSTAEIVINDFLSFEGFVDMSYSHTSQEDGNTDESDNSFGLDQVEIDWLFDFGTVTGQIDLAYEGSDGDQETAVEQAFATYHMENGSAITAGRFASQLGFEAFEPTGLYQYSFAYNAAEDVVDGNGDGPFASDGGVLPGYDQGVKYTYTTDTSYFGIALVDSVSSGRLGGDDDLSGYGIEVAGSYDLGNGFVVFAGARLNDTDNDTDSTILNTYVTYETGAWVFAAELVSGDLEDGTNADIDVLQGLLMANYAYSDVASITGRLSMIDSEQGNGEEDFTKYTLAHGYAFTDNLFLVNEVSLVDGEIGADDYEELTFAVELLFTF